MGPRRTSDLLSHALRGPVAVARAKGDRADASCDPIACRDVLRCRRTCYALTWRACATCGSGCRLTSRPLTDKAAS